MKAAESKKTYFFLYTLGFICVAVLAFWCFAVSGRTFILRGNDGYKMQYPMLVRVHNILMDLIRGRGFSFWSGDIGIGTDTLGALSKYLASPFALFSALFPASAIDIGYTAACILRIYVAGLITVFFLRYHGHSAAFSAAGGVGYACSSWTMAVIVHDIFLDPLVWFPLLIFGIDRMLEERKGGCLVLGVFFSLSTYPYFAYMSAIFCGIYVLTRYFFGVQTQKRSFVHFFRTVVLPLGSRILIACAISAPFLFSSLSAVLSAEKGTGMRTDLIPSFAELIRTPGAFIGQYSIYSQYSYYGSSALFAAGIPVCLLYLKKPEKRVPILIFFFAAFIHWIPMWGRIMNGFSYRTSRWNYCLIFFYVWAIVTCLDEKEKLSTKKTWLSLAWGILLMGSMLITEFFLASISLKYLRIIFWNFAFFFLFVLYLRLPSHKRNTTAGAVLLVLLVGVNMGGSTLFKYSEKYGNSVESFDFSGNCWNAYQSSVLRAGSTIDDPEYYRVDYIQCITPTAGESTSRITGPNEAIFWGVKSLNAFLSVVDSRIIEMEQALGNSTIFRRCVLISNDNRSRMDFLQNVRYFLLEAGRANTDEIRKYAGYGFTKTGESLGVEILKNSMDTSVGYVYSSAVSEDAFMEWPVLDREQVMMQHVVLDEKTLRGLDIPSYDISGGNTQIDTLELSFEVAEESEIQSLEQSFDVRKQTVLTLRPSQEQNAELYILLNGITKTPFSDEEYGDFAISISMEGRRKIIRNWDGNPVGRPEMEDYLVNLGYFEKTPDTVSVIFSTPGTYQFDSIHFLAVPDTHLREQASALSQQRVTDVRQDKDTITGNFIAQQDGVLYLSIPYSEGWEVWIDGTKTEKFRANIAFIGAAVSGGRHELVLRYRPPYYRVRILLSTMGLASWAALLFLDGRKRKRERKNQG